MSSIVAASAQERRAPQNGWTADPVVGDRHVTEEVSGGHPERTVLDLYRQLLEQGRSALIRPREPYEGLDIVTQHVVGLAGGRLTVTDLSTSCVEVGDLASSSLPAEAVIAFHTSGSTGLPKCVVYRRETMWRHAGAIAAALSLREEREHTTFIALPPPNFAYGLSIVNSHALTGVPVRFIGGEWGLPELHEIVETSDLPISLYLLPQHVPLLLASGIPQASVRRVLVAGGSLSTTAARSLASSFPQAHLTNMYGQAELGPRLTTWNGSPGDFAEGTIGHPLPEVSLDIRADDGGPQSDGSAGRIHALTPYAMSWLIPPPYDTVVPHPSDVPVDTGDLGSVDAAGVLHHHGRADHILNVAGTKVDAARLRGLIERAFEPLMVRVSSRPARLGGDVVPVVDIVPGKIRVQTGAVRRVLHAEIGSIAGLLDIRIVDQLQLTESGK